MFERNNGLEWIKVFILCFLIMICFFFSICKVFLSVVLLILSFLESLNLEGSFFFLV